MIEAQANEVLPFQIESAPGVVNESATSLPMCQLMEAHPIAVRVTSLDGSTLLFANAHYRALVKHEEGEILQSDPASFYKRPEEYHEIVHRVAVGETVSHRLIEMKSVNGEQRWASASFVRMPFDGVPAIFGWLTDVTEIKLNEMSMRLHASVFDNAIEGIIITDANKAIVSVNQAFTAVTGYSLEEVIGQNPKFLSSGIQSSEFYRDLWDSVNSIGRWRGEIWNRKKSGELFAELLTMTAIRDANGTVVNYVASFIDITDLKSTQRRLEGLAHYDVLTKLPNRVLLMERMNSAISAAREHGHRCAVLFLDLDGFKPVNDAFGHFAGDQLLIELAQRIKSACPDNTTIARLGGDEFVILMNDAGTVDGRNIAESNERILKLAHNVQDALSKEFLIGEESIKLAASIGVSVFPDDSEDPDNLLRDADMAMYEAKQRGKGSMQFFSNAYSNENKRKHAMQDMFAKAIANNEFELHYQPKVNLKTGKVSGVEALIRWNHPENGLMHPVDFLPFAEESDFIIELGDWVVQTAINQVVAWNGLGHDLQVSVNVAGKQLQSPDFIEKLRGFISGASNQLPRFLQMEILENSALEIESSSKTIEEIASTLGITFALDDFGTGFSSLAYLKSLPAQALKIDQRFIRDILEDAGDLELVTAIIHLARNFKKQVVAEGVETKDHLRLLRQLGCDEAQGYGIARPMRADQVIAWKAEFEHSFEDYLND